MVKSYKKLTAYQKAYQLFLMVYKMTASFPKEELYGLSSQMRRSAVSIPSNIAEGYMPGSKEYIQFLKIALGSAAELETQISISKDLGFCKGDVYKEAYELNREVMKLLKTYVIKMSGNSANTNF
jgi:four helix bundle protein